MPRSPLEPILQNTIRSAHRKIFSKQASVSRRVPQLPRGQVSDCRLPSRNPRLAGPAVSTEKQFAQVAADRAAAITRNSAAIARHKYSQATAPITLAAHCLCLPPSRTRSPILLALKVAKPELHAAQTVRGVEPTPQISTAAVQVAHRPACVPSALRWWRQDPASLHIAILLRGQRVPLPVREGSRTTARQPDS